MDDIEELVSSTNFVTITLNGMLYEYQIGIIGLQAREEAHTFDEWEGMLMQEEQR